MQFDPPIASRSTEELFEIIRFPDIWHHSAIEQAHAELLNRGISDAEKEEHIVRSNERDERNLRKELQSRSDESYGIIFLIIMAVRWPYAVFSDWYLKCDGYHRMHKERLYSIFGGVVLYAAFIVWAVYSYDEKQAEWQNEINRQDIYEWEREFYSDEEIAEFRTKSIDQAIQKVKENSVNGIPTYVLVASDTIPNSEIEELYSIDPLTIREVVIEREVKPEIYDRISIKLINTEGNSH